VWPAASLANGEILKLIFGYRAVAAMLSIDDNLIERVDARDVTKCLCIYISVMRISGRRCVVDVDMSALRVRYSHPSAYFEKGTSWKCTQLNTPNFLSKTSIANLQRSDMI
jgi:hypothetical protein